MTKWTADDIGDQTGRTAVVTGANSGLGFETAAALAAHGARVVLAVRTPAKGEAAAEQIRQRTADADMVVQQLDLASLASIREAATQLREEHLRIDLLINNAGVMYTPKQLTADGFEMQFGTNHLGHFALTGLLLEGMLETPGSRVVTVSSIGHRIRADIHFDDLQWGRRYSSVGAYGQAKLANLLFTYELQRRLIGRRTIALAAHPGGSNTNLDQYMTGVGGMFSPLMKRFAQSPAAGALPTLRAATDPSALGGQYYGPDGFLQTTGHPKVVASSDRSHDTDVQARLWTVSEELTGVVFPT
jgi:NAD(P)-dependent dehydrogenase (short-subunit alcohol dehydrogenase family)